MYSSSGCDDETLLPGPAARDLSRSIFGQYIAQDLAKPIFRLHKGRNALTLAMFEVGFFGVMSWAHFPQSLPIALENPVSRRSWCSHRLAPCENPEKQFQSGNSARFESPVIWKFSGPE